VSPPVRRAVNHFIEHAGVGREHGHSWSDLLAKGSVEPTSRRVFLVKWRDFPETEATWEPEENLSSCRSLLDAYLRRKHAPLRLIREATDTAPINPSLPLNQVDRGRDRDPVCAPTPESRTHSFQNGNKALCVIGLAAQRDDAGRRVLRYAVRWEGPGDPWSFATSDEIQRHAAVLALEYLERYLEPDESIVSCGTPATAAEGINTA
jgi:hypothetical protein